MATAQVFRAGTKTDGYGDTVEGAKVATGEPFSGFYGPGSPSESAEPGEVSPVDSGTFYARTRDALDIKADDELDIDGVRYLIIGIPQDWKGPMGRQGYAISVRRVPRR